MQRLIAIIGLFLILFSPKSLVYCQRDKNFPGYCTVENSGILRSEVREIPLEKIKKARLIVQKDKKQPQFFYQQNNSQVILLVDGDSSRDREIPLEVSSKQNKSIQDINAFLADRSQKQLELYDRHNWWRIIGLIIFLAGIYPLIRKR